MKKLWKRAAAIALAGCMAAAMTGCGSASKSAMYANADSAMAEMSYGSSSMGGKSYDYEEMQEVSMDEGYDMDGNTSADSVKENAANVDTGRKLIRTVNLSVETKEFDQMMETLQDQVEGLGGYIENMDTYNGSTYHGYSEWKNATVTIRMPKNELQGFLDNVSGICNIVRHSESVEDVTLSYVDMESRRNALRTEQERLLAFLEQAETIEEIITIEDRLTDVRYQLESMESQLRTYDNKIDYATVYLDIEEVRELTPIVEAEETAWKRIAEGFMTNLKDVGRDLEDFGIGFVIHIPYMSVWAVIIAVIVVVIKLVIRGNKKRKQKRLPQQQSQQPQMPAQQTQVTIPEQNAAAQQSKQDKK